MPEPTAPPDPSAVVTHEQDGRVLSGVGVTVDQLAETMDRHAPPDPAPPAPAPPAPPVASAAGVETPATPDPTAQPQTRGRARFSELAAQRDSERQKREAAERERDELKARLAQQPSAPAERREPERAPEPPPPTRPEPSEDEIGGKYPTYAAFTKDQALWVWEQQQQAMRSEIQRGIEQDHVARRFYEHRESTWQKGRAAYPDFDRLLQEGPGGQVQMPMERIHAIYASPASEHLQYVIMKDAQLAHYLAQLSPIGFGVALAQLTAQHSGNGHGNGTAPPPLPPAPYAPVGSGSKTTVPPATELAKGFDFDKSGYRERRAAERGVKPRR
jgi:hypothetical protein